MFPCELATENPHTLVPRMICLSPGTNREQRAYSQAMVRMTCRVDLKQQMEYILLDHHNATPTDKVLLTFQRPVPDFDGVPGGGEDGQVVRAEGQRADVGAVAAQREASRLIGRRRLVRSLQAVGLDGVVLQQQRHLQLTAGTRQTLHPSERRRRRCEFLRHAHSRHLSSTLASD